MTNTATTARDDQSTLTGRLTDSLLNWRLGFFIAELVLVVTGILIALAIDGWVNDARDRRAEDVYLELLVRDIEEIRQQANLQIEFEKDKIETGANAYAALSEADPRTKKSEIALLLSVLSSRRTLSISSATYNEMVSSGHLELIRNRKLRDSILRFFAQMELNELIVEKNNRSLIDEVYTPFLMRVGISVIIRSTELVPALSRANRILVESLGPDFTPPEDRVLSEPPDSDSWNDIRRNVLFRIRIASVGQSNAQAIVDNTYGIAQEIATELDRR